MDQGAEIQSKKEYPYEVRTRIVGNVQQETVGDIVGTIKDVFKEMDYMDAPPEEVGISQGGVQLPSGEVIAACYVYDEKGKPGKILVSTEVSKAWFNTPEIPINIATAAYAAHEAVEHVNNMRGKDLLSSHRALTHEEHQSESEDEANSIARQVIIQRYGWTVQFGDELWRQQQGK